MIRSKGTAKHRVRRKQTDYESAIPHGVTRESGMDVLGMTEDDVEHVGSPRDHIPVNLTLGNGIFYERPPISKLMNQASPSLHYMTTGSNMERFGGVFRAIAALQDWRCPHFDNTRSANEGT